jgi:glycosyltransferase involved in cell wall biosynthesis
MPNITENKPKVSICIPIYNDEYYVGEALESLIHQTYTNIEIIFSNNCSTDRSVDIIKSYNDPRVKIFNNDKNIGGAKNFEKVFTYATGKYMSYLSSDDKVEKTAIEKAVNILENPKNKDIVLVNTYIGIIDNNSKQVFIKRYPFGKGRIKSYWGIRSNFIYGSNCIGEPNGSVWRSEVFEKIPKPLFQNSVDWTGDLDLKLELILLGNTYMIPEPLGKFRVSKDSGSNVNLRFKTASQFRKYALNIYKDKRYNLGFGWVIIATITSFILMILRNLFYMFFIKEKKQ